MQVQAFTDGDTLYADMQRAIANARYSIFVESYIFALDEVGLVIFEALKERAEANVMVEVVADFVGSFALWLYTRKNPHLFKKIKLRWFNPFKWLSPSELNRRDHKKILLIDQQLLFVGGFNIERSSSAQQNGKDRWRDFHLKIEGELAREFSKNYQAATQSFRQPEVVSDELGTTSIILSEGRYCRRMVHCKLHHRFASAVQSIAIVNAYFIPSKSIFRQLIGLVKSGVEVSLYVPEKSDHTIINVLSRWYFKQLARIGVQIYIYPYSMLHSKIILIDDTIAMTGSANMDYRSFFVNQEILLESTNEKIVNPVREEIQYLQSVSKKTIDVQTRYENMWLLGLQTFAFFFRRWL